MTREAIKEIAGSKKTILAIIVSILSLVAPPVYKTFAKIEVHESQIARNTSDIKSLEGIREDVGYIKGAVDELRKLKGK